MSILCKVEKKKTKKKKKEKEGKKTNYDNFV